MFSTICIYLLHFYYDKYIIHFVDTVARFNVIWRSKTIFANAVGITLITATIAKGSTIHEFAGVLVASGLFDKEYVYLIAKIIVGMEFAMAVLLIAKFQQPHVFRASGILFSLFAAFHAWNWHEGIGVPCSCFGPWFKIPSSVGLVLNLLIALACIYHANLKKDN